MFDRLNMVGVRTIDIIGGEPTLHPQIVPMVQGAVQRGLNVNLSTNGSNTVVLDNLPGTDDKVAVGISINDRETLDRLAGFVHKNKVVVKSVFHPSMDEAFIHDILALRPKKFYLIYRDSLDRSDLHETVPFHQFMSVVEERFNSPHIGTVFCSGFIPDGANCPKLSQVRCPAGTTKLGILPDGSVYPCNLFFGKKDFLLGNILTDPFASIWNHTVLAFFRAVAENSCPETTCVLHSSCHGGCPAHSFAHTGDLNAPDPRCVGG